jgi:predicted amidohydrolase YtcJ
MRRLVILCSTTVLLSACNGAGSPSTPGVTPSPSGAPSAAPVAGASAAPTGMMAEATTLTIDGVAKDLPKTFEKAAGSRGTTYTIGNLKSSGVLDVPTIVFGVVPAGTSAGMQNLHWYAQQGNAQVEQTYQWDGAPETETWTQAGGKGTYTFKGKMKRILFGSVGPATITVEGSVSGIPL